MTEELQNELIRVFTGGFRPIDDSPIYDWLSDNIALPNIFRPEGKFDVNNYPYLKRPFDDLKNDAVKQLNVAACTQGGKSLLQQLYLPYLILESPGPVLMVYDKEDNAKKTTEERLIPLLESHSDIKKMLDAERFRKKLSGVTLPHMKVRIGGPTESNIHGYSAKVVLGDEVWQWQAQNHKDVIDKLKARQTAYNDVKKMVLVSQPDIQKSDWHTECSKGRWLEWGYHCTQCHILQPYVWNGEKDGKYYGVVMDATEYDENDNPNYNKKAESAKIVCQHCFFAIDDTVTNRRQLIRNGDYILIHDGGNKQIVTYSWGQFVNTSISLKEMALQYFEAISQKRNFGIRDKLDLFTQQVLGQFVKVGYQDETPKLYTEAYSSNEEWKDETIRFLTIDPQKDYLNWLIRTWSNKVPECRLIDWGTCTGFNDIEEVIKKYKIHPFCIGVDSGNDTKDIYKVSVMHGKEVTLNNGTKIWAQWHCLRGDGGNSPINPRNYYVHKLRQQNRIIEIHKLYDEVQLVDPQWTVDNKFRGKKANLYNWSNKSIKTVLEKLRDKKLPFNWKLNDRANGDYTHQMFSEQLNVKSKRYEKLHDKNHIWDLECMQLVLALKYNVYCPSAGEMNDLVTEG